MTPAELAEVLAKHDDWLRNREEGARADLRGADLSSADLSRADLRRAVLSGADLSRADLRGADLSRAVLRGADLSDAVLSDADLRRADLRGAVLRGADLRGAVLSDAVLSDADLRRADLSGAKGLPSSVEWLGALEHTEDGYIAYKTFGSQYAAPSYWTIAPGSVISEVCNPDRGTECACGINLAPLAWVHKNHPGDEVWKCLIRWEWAAGIVVPFGTDGKFRCERCELVEVVA